MLEPHSSVVLQKPDKLMSSDSMEMMRIQEQLVCLLSLLRLRVLYSEEVSHICRKVLCLQSKRKLGYSTYIWISKLKVKYLHFLACRNIRCGRSTECCSLRDSWSWCREFCCTTNRRYSTIYVSRSTRIGKNNQVLPWSSCIPTTIGGAAESIERNVVGTIYSPSTLEQQILKSEKLILVFLLIETTLHSMHSSNRLKMLRELFSSILQILQKQHSILSKYTMVMVQLHYLVHIPNSSSLHTCWSWWTCETWSCSQETSIWLCAKVPSTHLLALPKVSRENLLQERFFTPRLVLQRSESRMTLSTPQEHYYQQEQQQKPDMFPLYPASGTITISGELTHPEIRYIPAVTTGGLSTAFWLATAANVIVPFASGRFFSIGSGDE